MDSMFKAGGMISMEKSIVNMTNWELYVYDGRYNLSGTADNHPSLGKNVYISYTTDVVDYSLKDDILTYETRNTCYKCPLKFMNIKPYPHVLNEYKQELSHIDENSDSELDKIIAAAAQISLNNEQENKMQMHNMQNNVSDNTLSDDSEPDSTVKGEFAEYILKLVEAGKKELADIEKKDNERRYEVIKDIEDCIYIELSNITGGDKLAYHINGKYGVVEPVLHSGMFQDSILYRKFRETKEDAGLDFRYFPMAWGDALETYSWSDNIKCAVIKNDKSRIIKFNGENVYPGEIKTFYPETHKEGLLSPDCYNGKSVFTED